MRRIAQTNAPKDRPATFRTKRSTTASWCNIFRLRPPWHAPLGALLNSFSFCYCCLATINAPKAIQMRFNAFLLTLGKQHTHTHIELWWHGLCGSLQCCIISANRMWHATFSLVVESISNNKSGISVVVGKQHLTRYFGGEG